MVTKDKGGEVCSAVEPGLWLGRWVCYNNDGNKRTLPKGRRRELQETQLREEERHSHGARSQNSATTAVPLRISLWKVMLRCREGSAPLASGGDHTKESWMT
ncbi:hypothetical protein KP509_07G019200 [Ceratopteris richardii]|uniref:Uncharacterized protein n=2 Tax=Ceratopteris richardii TaxID=49495 RepID=A0A8T2U802_CERRI|nr:hypothetical protein KP509_07G019200 [Ceratopteris richardii]